MPEHFNLDNVEPDARFEHFCEIAESLNVPESHRCDVPERFRYLGTRRTLGEVRAGKSLITPVQIERTRHHIARLQGDDVKLVIPLSGGERQSGEFGRARPDHDGGAGPHKPALHTWHPTPDSSISAGEEIH
ncbi:hypothetical protein P0D75_28395 [Paraburkholderia sediminicola]|uniref:hypothetical protein n=1 Tax=Paraburkholderia sediminicola TaxID=458836 RepID=UPI0038B9F997